MRALLIFSCILSISALRLTNSVAFDVDENNKFDVDGEGANQKQVNEMEQMWTSERERSELEGFLDNLGDLDEADREFVRWRWTPDASFSRVNSSGSYPISDRTIEQIGACTGKMMHTPEEKQTLYFQDKKLESMLNAVDQIYVICGHCRKTFPESLLKKVSFLSYKKLNKCLVRSGDHRQQCAASHKAAVLHAKQNQYKKIAIFEEDAHFDADTSKMDLKSVEQLIQSNDKPWELMRLGWWWHGQSKWCNCHQWTEQNMCTMDSGSPMKWSREPYFCDMHTSNGYIMSERAFDQYLKPSHHAVDGGMLNQFQQTIIFPALIHEPITEWKGKAAKRSESGFVDHHVKGTQRK